MTRTSFPPVPTALLLDTSFLRTLGGPGHHRHQLFTEYVKATDIELYLSERVRQEIEEQEGWISPDWLHKSQTESWVTAAQPVQEGVSVYDGPSAAVIMDRIQQRLSKIEQIPPDKLRKTDAGLAGTAIMILASTDHDDIGIVMDDKNAEQTIQAVLSDTYYEDYIRVFNIWDIIEFIEE
ncbi:hypothetical protein SAMN05421858_4841 [Haladaptatus litoreus]|uniref:DUF4411 family protein n=1 Tax=Haladaptatus litoreus TaxID=553468 RepID=A0A1N7F9B7_9EURY|nr:hypothetical protein SAMN05421858_4841 [Haladaptatus litoreus]